MHFRNLYILIILFCFIMEKKFNEIQKRYFQENRKLLKEGKLPLRETSKGFWGSAVLSEVFTLFKKINLSKYKNFLDIGSGDGRVALVASLFTDAKGIEIDKDLHEKSVEMKKKLRSKAEFIHGDFFKHDLSKYDVIFCFPDKPLHYGLEEKLMKELKGKFILYGPNVYPVKLKEDLKLNIDGTIVSVFSR